MTVKFTLIMDNLLLNGRFIDRVVLEWEEEKNQGEVLEISHEWISTQHYLTQKIPGLHSVGESSLTIEPT